MSDYDKIREIVFDMLMMMDKEQNPSHIVLSRTLEKYQYLDKRQRAFISRLFKGTLEYQIYLDQVIKQFSNVAFGRIKRPVRILLRMGAYQILMLDSVRPETACDETVKLAKRRGLKSLSGFINAVLRNISRNKDNIAYPDKNEDPVGYLSMSLSLPHWLASMWIKDYGYEKAFLMGQSALRQRALSIRLRVTDDDKKREKILDEFKENGIAIEAGSMIKEAYRISGYDYLGNLDAFTEGYITVQDEAAMLAALAAGVKPGDNVIDVCAAPGGKSIHMADLMGESGHVEARDLTELKTGLILENIRRMKVSNVTAQVADALVFRPEDENKADVVMADLPCSGLGVIGRKPDIKHNMTPDKIKELAALQRDILSVVWRYVKPGGVLIYSTCTVSRQENQDNVKWFLENFPFREESMDEFIPEELKSPKTARGYRQILLGEYDLDGFFIARFRRDN